jgi:hypothetical protein
MHEQIDSLNWGPTRRRSDPRTKKISRGLATSGSDEAIVSEDLAGQYNRLVSQGPLDESVWGWEPISCPQGPQVSREHTRVAYKSGTPRRRSRRTSRLKPYWGKPAVRNFREGRGNTMAKRVSQTLNGPCDIQLDAMLCASSLLDVLVWTFPSVSREGAFG